MGLGRVLSFIRSIRNGAKLSDVKVDPGGGPNVTAEHFSAPGDDAYPLPGDYVVSVAIQRSGGSAIVGYLDPKNDQRAGAGEKRIYARDSEGASIVEMWLKNTGEAVLSNSNGSITLSPNGNIDIVGAAISITGSSITIMGATNVNGATISTGGEVTTASSVALGTHSHAQGADSDGDTQQETNSPTI
jgi:hypothetical protein